MKEFVFDYEAEVKEAATLIPHAIEVMGEKNRDDLVVKEYRDPNEHDPAIDGAIDGPRPSEEYADLFVNYIMTLNNGGFTGEQVKALWETYYALTSTFLNVALLSDVIKDDSYVWHTFPDDDAEIDTGGIRMGPMVFPLCCSVGFSSSYMAIGSNPETRQERVRELLKHWISKISEKPNKSVCHKELLKTEFSFIETAFYVGSLFANLRVAKGIFALQSPEIVVNSSHGVQRIIETVSEQLEFLSRLNEDAKRIQAALKSAGFFEKDRKQDLPPCRAVAAFQLAKPTEMQEGWFSPLKVLNEGLMAIGGENYHHFHLESKDASEHTKFKNLFSLNNRSKTKSTEEALAPGAFKPVKMGSASLFLPKRYSESEGNFHKLTRAVNGGQFKAVVVVEQHRKSKVAFFHKLL